MTVHEYRAWRHMNDNNKACIFGNSPLLYAKFRRIGQSLSLSESSDTMRVIVDYYLDHEPVSDTASLMRMSKT